MKTEKDMFLLSLLKRELQTVLDRQHDWEYRLKAYGDNLSDDEIQFMNDQITKNQTRASYLLEQIQELNENTDTPVVRRL